MHKLTNTYLDHNLGLLSLCVPANFPAQSSISETLPHSCFGDWPATCSIEQTNSTSRLL